MLRLSRLPIVALLGLPALPAQADPDRTARIEFVDGTALAAEAVRGPDGALAYRIGDREFRIPDEIVKEVAGSGRAPPSRRPPTHLLRLPDGGLLPVRLLADDGETVEYEAGGATARRPRDRILSIEPFPEAAAPERPGRADPPGFARLLADPAAAEALLADRLGLSEHQRPLLRAALAAAASREARPERAAHAFRARMAEVLTDVQLALLEEFLAR